jgi:predicted DNA-binding protein YlxM (UPF0122 family)
VSDEVWKKAVVDLLKKHNEKIEDLEIQLRMLLMRNEVLEKKIVKLKKKFLRRRKSNGKQT